MNEYILLAFCIYACILLGIGLFFFKRSRSLAQYTLGNRSTNYFVTAIATQASDMSGWLMLGLPAQVYANGIEELWTIAGLVFFMFISWHIIAPRIRNKAAEYKSLTLTSLLSAYFKDTHNILKIAGALISVYFFTCYIASGIVGMGRVFETAFTIPYHSGIVLGIIITLFYTLLGGFLAVSWANTFQGIFLLCMIMVVPFSALFTLNLVPFSLQSFLPSAPTAWHQTVHGILLSIGWGIGYFGQPHILTYFMGIDDPKNIRYAKYVGMIWQLSALCAAAFIGLIGARFFGINTVLNAEMLFITLSEIMFHPLVVGFTLCAILAAILTSISSYLLIAASNITTDFMLPLAHTSFTDRQLVLFSRIAACLVAFLSLAISWQNSATIYHLVNYAWSGLGAAFGPLVIIMLNNKPVSAQTACKGMIFGAVTAALWPLFGIDVLPLIPGFIVNILILIELV